MKIDTEIRSRYKTKQNIKEQIKEHIQERMEKHMESLQEKNRIKTNNINVTDQDNFNKLMDHVFDNTTKFETKMYKLPSKYTSPDLKEFTNSTDYEQMWEIAIDKWTRNWNFYREQLTDSILEKFQLNNKRNKRQTKKDYVELKGQNINGSAVGPQDIFIEHYDCDAEEITNVKYYELNKISTCKFKPLDLEMTKTEVQLLSKAQAVEIKAYAVTGTIKEKVEWCSQHTHYIRANRPSYYVSDARRTKILDPDEVRNELARINVLKNTKYRPTRHNISFNYLSNPPLQKRLENVQGNIQFRIDTPMVHQHYQTLVSRHQASQAFILYQHPHHQNFELTHFYRQQHNKDKISILYKNTSVYNQYNHQIAHFGQQHHHNNQQVQVQHHEEHQEHPH